MKKFCAMILSAVLFTSIFSGCSPTTVDSGANKETQQTQTDGENKESGESKDNKEPANGEKKYKVALLYSGFLGDKSFNDSAHEGAMKAAEEFGIEIKEMQSKEPTEWESNFIAMASDDYDLIIGVSTQFQEIMAKHCPDYPDKKFAIIDGVVEGDNIVSSTFAQNEGSFLAGAAAAMFTTQTDIDGINSEKIIGWVGGMDVPVLQDFFIGYEQGAKYIDPEIQVLRSFAGSFSDPLKGKELTLAQYSQGADIVMNVASGTGVGILEAAKESGKYAIGVDLDQDGIYPGSILTSMLKNVDQATYLTIESAINGTFEGGSVTYLNIANGGVGLTDMSVMREALGDKFPEEIVTRIQELQEKIKSGEITVEFYDGFGPK